MSFFHEIDFHPLLINCWLASTKNSIYCGKCWTVCLNLECLVTWPFLFPELTTLRRIDLRNRVPESKAVLSLNVSFWREWMTIAWNNHCSGEIDITWVASHHFWWQAARKLTGANWLIVWGTINWFRRLGCRVLIEKLVVVWGAKWTNFLKLYEV